MNIYLELHDKDNFFVNEKGGSDAHAALPRMSVFNADETTKLLALIAPHKRPRLETFNFAPPFPRFFVQASLPSAYADYAAESCTQVQDRDGTLHNRMEVDRMNEVGMDVTVSENDLSSVGELFTTAGVKPDFRWAMSCRLYYGTSATLNPLCRSFFSVLALLDKDGALIPFDKETDTRVAEKVAAQGRSGLYTFLKRDGIYYTMMLQHAAPSFDDLSPDVASQFTRTFEEYLPLFFAINSLHSKRTVQVSRPPSRQQRRHAQQHGRQVPPTYIEIKVKGFIEVYKDARAAKAAGRDYPLHDVIGHYSLYGIEGRKKLFGKYTGRYWFESHLRGNPDFGATDHDYKVGMTA